MTLLSATLLALGLAGLATTGADTNNDIHRVSYTGYAVVSITPETTEEANFLSRLRAEMKLDFWLKPVAPRSSVVVNLAPEKRETFFRAVSGAGMKAAILESNLQRLIDSEKQQQSFPEFATDNLRFRRYLTNPEFESALKSYANDYAHVNYTTIGKSSENKDIVGVHITAGANKPIIFVECGIHAREWIAPATCLYFIDQLATQYATDARIQKLVDNLEWRIYPVVNPDGYDYSHKIDRLWRKTRSKSKNSFLCRGTDANRNFDVGTFCGDGTSDNPCSDTYCGDSVFSESESRAIRDAVLAANGRISYYFSFHSYGLLWTFPYSYTASHASNYEEMLNISTRGADAIRNSTGTVYQVGQIAQVIYQVTGSSVDWVYDTANVKRAFALELQPKGALLSSLGFLLPAKDILPTAKETWTGIRAAIGYPE